MQALIQVILLRLVKNLLFFPEVESTQNFAKEMTSKAQQENIQSSEIIDEDFMILTDYQTKGRGRRENVWISKDSGVDPLASLTFTFTRTIPYQQVLKFKLYPYLVGVALARSLNNQYFPDIKGAQVQLKWPNDAYLGGKKFSGCLEEGEKLNSLDLGKVYIGLGININEGHGFTCLAEHTQKSLEKLDILKSFTEEFLELEKLLGIENNDNSGVRKLLDLYESLWMHHGQEVTLEVPEFQLPGIRLNGKIAGITDEGFLKVSVGDNLYESYPADDYSLDIKNSRIIRKLQ
ncbi:biotin--acetyl--carboxylase ligase [Stylonychia lemnae]|uniref:Biotin--acetyl--carboxylase ligase n=1 Tax=Stylonychia lemnae TaxID=5949 RepID=A0A078A8I9_STYLE|nr:biotin--acetyl--carboxylase ligase [Stylonychia lemnae]|eukprot:CDW78585.1 biotin--acetyl--carboxylase ligase [Stylonychia lemnae]